MYSFSTEVQATWQNALSSGRPSSSYFWMVVIFNALNLLQLAILFMRHHSEDPSLTPFIIVIVFLLVTMGHYAMMLYSKARKGLKSLSGDGEQQLLHISYLGYRLYLLGLCIGVASLGYFNLILRAR